ncbi:MAG: aminotransferase class III-fold pyridoxal phosphate-dependent enzyme [Deltaproteobacteria bacterium]|nr:aminotransferase class III-fold pyridoxal phosphate-dependent enzyme [Deltaproteobacteria bacterium]
MNKEAILKNNLEYTLFSWSAQSGLNPINIERAKGVYIYDRDGKKYIDFSSQLMNVNIGHGHPKIAEAVAKQMSEVSYVYPGMATEPRGLLGKKLAEISPGSLKKTFFTNAGAEAIENAIKLARLYTGRHKIITRYRSFHGASYGAVSAGGDPRKFEVDRCAMPGVVHVEDPYCYRCSWSQEISSCKRECAAHVERVIKFEGPDSIAAILMEGESGSSGCIKYPPDYWKRMREIADRYGIVLIADEVMSGFGRCGQWFGIQNYDVEPDIIVMAKGLTSGYVPLGGIIVSEKICKAFDTKPLLLGLTYSAHAVGCAAALACLKVYEDENLIQNAREMGRYVDIEVEKMKLKHPSIGDFRNTALFGCIELVKNRTTKEPMAPWNATAKEMGVMTDVAAKIRELGMFTFVRWNYIFIAPPLTITKAEIDEGLAIISKAITLADRCVC